jgi:peroxiredoxin
VLKVGDAIPQAPVQRAPGEELDLADLPREGAVLLFFYLFDWSST